MSIRKERIINQIEMYESIVKREAIKFKQENDIECFDECERCIKNMDDLIARANQIYDTEEYFFDPFSGYYDILYLLYDSHNDTIARIMQEREEAKKAKEARRNMAYKYKPMNYKGIII